MKRKAYVILVLAAVLTVCSCKTKKEPVSNEITDPTEMVDISYERTEAQDLSLNYEYVAGSSYTGKESFNIGDYVVRGKVIDEYELDISYKYACSPADESKSHNISSILEFEVLAVYGDASPIKIGDTIKLVSKQCSEFQEGFIDVATGGEYIFIIKDYIGSSEIYAQFDDMKSYADYMIVSPYYMVAEKTGEDEYDADVFIKLLQNGNYNSDRFDKRKMYSLEEVENIINENVDELKGLDKLDIFNDRTESNAD